MHATAKVFGWLKWLEHQTIVAKGRGSNLTGEFSGPCHLSSNAEYSDIIYLLLNKCLCIWILVWLKIDISKSEVLSLSLSLPLTVPSPFEIRGGRSHYSRVTPMRPKE